MRIKRSCVSMVSAWPGTCVRYFLSSWPCVSTVPPPGLLPLLFSIDELGCLTSYTELRVLEVKVPCFFRCFKAAAESPPSLTVSPKPYPSLCYPSLIKLPWGYRAGVMKGLTFRVGRAGHRSCIFLFLTFIQCPLLLMRILKS